LPVRRAPDELVTMLEVRGVRKSYGATPALVGVDFDVAAGEVVGLLGPNGAGKTTLVSIVAGLRRPDAGRVSVAGIDVLSHPFEARRHLGLAPQELGIYPTLTVRTNLQFFGELVDLRGAELRHRVDEVGEALELSEFMDRQARFLSGGEKRRLHTALTMLRRPPLLLLDEPTSGVDVRTRASVLEVVRSLAAEGSAVCYSTHYLGEVEALGASVAILDRGRMIARGTVADLVRSHGASALELTFEDDGRPLPALSGYRTDSGDGVLRVFTERPAAEAARVLAALGAETGRLRSVEIVAPSLEAVFLALTGRRYESEDEQSDVAVS
jgi:ABC-2 type transport system ATP-binding protein